MPKRGEIYQCLKCGNIIEILTGAEGALACCGQPMQRQQEKTADSTLEKHVPFIQREGDKYTVRIGENTEHPMEEKHYIQWIAINADNQVYRTYLKPGDKPRTKIALSKYPGSICVRAYCNVHGLWETCAE